MFDRIHRKLGTAGFVISIVALVAALGGGAYAASGGLSGKQKKEVQKIAQAEAKKVAGKPGATGATGPAGAAGAAGAKGETGAPGTAGANGSPGANGTNGKNGVSGFTEFLPAGETETGAWSTTTSGAGLALAPISFPIPIPTALGSTHVHYVPSLQSTTECPGTAANPLAEEGNLCVYEKVVSGFKGTTPTSGITFAEVFPAGGTPVLAFGGETGAGINGAVLLLQAEEEAFGWGSYAVTP